MHLKYFTRYAALLIVGLAFGAGCSSSQSENTPANPEAGKAAAERPTLPANARRAIPAATTIASATDGGAAEAAFDPAGISRRYMGRQIARVMGHESNAYFGRATREKEERPDLLLQELHLRPTDAVADIGAGSGYLTFRLASLVPKGTVYAVDIQPQQILLLTNEVMQRGLSNVKPVRGTTQTPNLAPNSVDVVLLNDAYHEFAYPKEMMTAIVRALRPKGRVVLVEYRAADDDVPASIHGIRRMSIEQGRKELTAAGLAYREARETLPRHHLMFFEKAPE